MRPVAAGDINSVADFLGPCGTSERGLHAVTAFVNSNELGATLHLNSESGEPIDEQTLVSILRVHQRKREWREAFAQSRQRQMRSSLPTRPEIHAWNLYTTFNQRFSEIDMLVELERPRCNSDGARGRSRFCGLIDNSYRDAELAQPERKHKARRSRADNQYGRIA